MWKWRPVQYRGVWDAFYISCDADTQNTIDHRLDHLLEKGNLTREPISKPLRDQIFELRAKDARLLYFFGPNRTVVFVHAVHKKRSDVPRQDIELAIERKNSILEYGEVPYELAQSDQIKDC